MKYSVLLFTHKNWPEAGISNMWPSGLWGVACLISLAKDFFT